MIVLLDSCQNLNLFTTIRIQEMSSFLRFFGSLSCQQILDTLQDQTVNVQYWYSWYGSYANACQCRQIDPELLTRCVTLVHGKHHRHTSIISAKNKLACLMQRCSPFLQGKNSPCDRPACGFPHLICGSSRKDIQHHIEGLLIYPFQHQGTCD